MRKTNYTAKELLVKLNKDLGTDFETIEYVRNQYLDKGRVQVIELVKWVGDVRHTASVYPDARVPYLYSSNIRSIDVTVHDFTNEVTKVSSYKISGGKN